MGCAGKKYGDWKIGWAKEIEDRILDYLCTQAQFSGIDLLWVDVIVKPIIQDVPLLVWLSLFKLRVSRKLKTHVQESSPTRYATASA